MAPFSWIVAILPIFCCPLWRVNRVSVKEQSSTGKGSPFLSLHLHKWVFPVSKRCILALAAPRDEALGSTFENAAVLFDRQAGLASAATAALSILLFLGRALVAAICTLGVWAALRLGGFKGLIGPSANGFATLCAAALVGWLGANISLSVLAPAVNVLLLAAYEDVAASACDYESAPSPAAVPDEAALFGTPNITTPCSTTCRPPLVSLAVGHHADNISANQYLSQDCCQLAEAPPSASGSATLMVADDTTAATTPILKAPSWFLPQDTLSGAAQLEPRSILDHSQLHDTLRRVPRPARRLFEDSSVVLAWAESAAPAPCSPPLASHMSSESVPPSLPTSGQSSPK